MHIFVCTYDIICSLQSVLEIGLGGVSQKVTSTMIGCCSYSNPMLHYCVFDTTLLSVLQV